MCNEVIVETVKDLRKALEQFPDEMKLLMPTKNRYSDMSINVREGKSVSTKGKLVIGV